MDKSYAIKLIQDVFQYPFNREQFTSFAKNLFNFLDTERNFVYRGNLIPDAYKPYIYTLERIGKYEDAEENKIDVLIVHLKKEHSIEHARSMQRNFIAWYLGGSRGGELKDAALVAFHTDNLDDWRFSLVKMDYQIVESETGKIKTKTELTPARRFSFLVGKNENSHTAQRQLFPILQDDKNNPLLSDFEKAFNIEVVTQEFFEKYKDLFLEVKDSLEQMIKKDRAIAQDFNYKGVDPVDFSKKLLGQIVFLYFLQKKGWFGVGRDEDWGTGPKNFLRLLFEKMITGYDNFFNNMLEPLFYEALAKERDDDFYSRFNCKIPFLNGGLFDPISNYDWVHTDICLSDELFSNQVKTKEGDTGTGILDIFDRYNFTVKEDEPLEKEVAVDPEMLGKVFENLLEVKDRKSKGTYYTPREIVHYMCQESLINYLVNECESKANRNDIETLIKYGESAVEHDSRVEQEGKETSAYSYKLPESIRKNAQLIDDKLENIRVCDPAIGSGAFPVGMMNEIIRTRNTLTNYLEDKEDRSIYSFKRNAIQNSLYGVDIDPGAVEIAKLRLWLSLVVDEEDIKQIKPLPNLDYKIMQGNSLLEEFEGVKLFDEELISKPTIDDNKYKDEIKERMAELQREYIQLHTAGKLTNVRKSELELELKKQVDLLKRLSKQEKTRSENTGLFDIFSEANKKAQELKQLHKEFFEASQKTKKDELKKRIENLEWELIETTLKEQNKISSLKKLEQYKKSNIKPFFLWKLHFSEVFEKNGRGGFDIVIANPPYVSFGLRGTGKTNDESVESLRRLYPNSAEYKLSLYAIFMDRGLQLLQDNGILTYITPDSFLLGRYFSELRRFILENCKITEILMFKKDFWESGVVGRPVITLLKKELNRNLRKNNKPLYKLYCTLDDFNKAIVEIYSYSQLYFDKTSYNRFRLFFSERQKSIVDKLQVGSKPLSEFVTFASGLIGKQGKSEIVSKEKLGPDWKPGLLSGSEIKKYFVNYEGNFILFDTKILKSGFKEAKYFDPKILLRQTGDSLMAAYDDKNLLCLNNLHVGNLKNKSSSLKYVLALLNSKLLNYYYTLISLETGRTMAQIDIETLEELPIKESTVDIRISISDLIDKIFTANIASKQSEIVDLEDQIDQLVYKLYGLTPEEVGIVEKDSN